MSSLDDLSVEDVDAAAAEGLHSVYQPIVDLSSDAVVGYEALARWPADSVVRRAGWPAARGFAREVSARIDWACRVAAFRGALEVGLNAGTTLFVNIEPETSDTSCPPHSQQLMARAGSEVPTIYEITERALAARPAELLRIVETLRAQGAGIALDDVGSDWRSLALMPVIEPDVVKLDMHLIQEPLTAQGALVAEAVRGYASRTGAEIVAEGIETEAHLQRALSLGATLGQGWYWGYPGALPAKTETVEEFPLELDVTSELIVTSPATEYSSPMDAIAKRSATMVAPKADLLAISRSFEQRALQTTEPCVLLSLFQDARWFTPTTARLYARLATRSAFVGAFGPGMSAEPATGVRGADVALNHRLLGEWSVILIAPHYTGALIAQDLGDAGPEMQRRFRFTVLHDRDLVHAAARSLMLNIAASDRLMGAGSDANAANDLDRFAEMDSWNGEADQALSDSDQRGADRDQISSDHDQLSADDDQIAANRDQAASDRNLAAGTDPHDWALSRDLRQRTARERAATSAARSDAGAIRRRGDPR